MRIKPTRVYENTDLLSRNVGKKLQLILQLITTNYPESEAPNILNCTIYSSTFMGVKDYRWVCWWLKKTTKSLS